MKNKHQLLQELLEQEAERHLYLLDKHYNDKQLFKKNLVRKMLQVSFEEYITNTLGAVEGAFKEIESGAREAIKNCAKDQSCSMCKEFLGRK